MTAYLSAARNVHASGAALPETSYYPALSNLLNAVGHALKPTVRRAMTLKNFGNGLPDGGLFTADPLARRTVDAALWAGQLPTRAGPPRSIGPRPPRKRSLSLHGQPY